MLYGIKHKLSCIYRDLIDSYISEINQTTDVNSPFYKETGREYNLMLKIVVLQIQLIQSVSCFYFNNFFADTNLHAVIEDVLTAGSETTSTTLNWTILYLTANPNVQEKLYQEIISVLGTTESPKLSDRSK